MPLIMSASRAENRSSASLRSVTLTEITVHGKCHPSTASSDARVPKCTSRVARSGAARRPSRYPSKQPASPASAASTSDAILHLSRCKRIRRATYIESLSSARRDSTINMMPYMKGMSVALGTFAIVGGLAFTTIAMAVQGGGAAGPAPATDGAGRSTYDQARERLSELDKTKFHSESSYRSTMLPKIREFFRLKKEKEAATESGTMSQEQQSELTKQIDSSFKQLQTRLKESMEFTQLSDDPADKKAHQRDQQIEQSLERIEQSLKQPGVAAPEAELGAIESLNGKPSTAPTPDRKDGTNEEHTSNTRTEKLEKQMKGLQEQLRKITTHGKDYTLTPQDQSAFNEMTTRLERKIDELNRSQQAALLQRGAPAAPATALVAPAAALPDTALMERLEKIQAELEKSKNTIQTQASTIENYLSKQDTKSEEHEKALTELDGLRDQLSYIQSVDEKLSKERNELTTQLEKAREELKALDNAKQATAEQAQQERSPSWAAPLPAPAMGVARAMADLSANRPPDDASTQPPKEESTVRMVQSAFRGRKEKSAEEERKRAEAQALKEREAAERAPEAQQRALEAQQREAQQEEAHRMEAQRKQVLQNATEQVQDLQAQLLTKQTEYESLRQDMIRMAGEKAQVDTQQATERRRIEEEAARAAQEAQTQLSEMQKKLNEVTRERAALAEQAARAAEAAPQTSGDELQQQLNKLAEDQAELERRERAATEREAEAAQAATKRKEEAAQLERQLEGEKAELQAQRDAAETRAKAAETRADAAETRAQESEKSKARLRQHAPPARRGRTLAAHKLHATICARHVEKCRQSKLQWTDVQNFARNYKPGYHDDQNVNQLVSKVKEYRPDFGIRSRGMDESMLKILLDNIWDWEPANEGKMTPLSSQGGLERTVAANKTRALQRKMRSATLQGRQDHTKEDSDYEGSSSANEEGRSTVMSEANTLHGLLQPRTQQQQGNQQSNHKGNLQSSSVFV